MSVSAVISGSGGTSDNSEIQVLQRQLANLQKQLQDEMLSKDSAKTKQIKEQQLQMQIDAANAQIALIKEQAAKAKQAKSGAQAGLQTTQQSTQQSAARGIDTKT